MKPTTDSAPILKTEADMNRHLRRQRRLSIGFLSAMLVCVIGGIVTVLMEIGGLPQAVPYCGGLTVCGLVAALIIAGYWRKSKDCTPYALCLPSAVSFEQIKRTMTNREGQGNCLDIPERSAFFCLTDNGNTRLLLLDMPEFDKEAFRSVNTKVNRRAAKRFPSSAWGRIEEMRFRMRITLIVSDAVNDELYRFMTHNAVLLLRRNEAIVRLCLVGDRLIVPPAWGEMRLLDVSRYRRAAGSVRILLTEAVNEEE